MAERSFQRTGTKTLKLVIVKPSPGSHGATLLISIPAFTFDLGLRANIKGSHHILSLLCPKQLWLCKSCYQDTHSGKIWGQKPAEENGKTHKGWTTSRSNHNLRNPVKSSTRLENIKQIFSVSISRKNISLLVTGLMKVWLEKIKGVKGDLRENCIFGSFSLCEQEMQLLTCAGVRSGLCCSLGKETTAGPQTKREILWQICEVSFSWTASFLSGEMRAGERGQCW